MFDKIESFRSLAGAVAIYVLIENISIPLLVYIYLVLTLSPQTT